jgi:RNase P/RNase MRP subunit POP5
MKLKPVMPSLRERKRYLTFEVISKQKISDASAVAKAITNSMLKFVGELGVSKAGLIVLSDSYKSTSQKGIVRVAHTSVDALKASLTFITSINGTPVTVRSVAVSGNINKAKANTK